MPLIRSRRLTCLSIISLTMLLTVSLNILKGWDTAKVNITPPSAGLKSVIVSSSVVVHMKWSASLPPIRVKESAPPLVFL
jgi:hypothetical protein